MIQVSAELRSALIAQENQPVDLYELYLDSGTLYYADQNITWGGHDYLGKVSSRTAIRRSEGAEFDRVSIIFSNVDRTLAELVLTNEIEGRRLMIRKVDRAVSNDSVVLFDGRMERPSRIDEKSCVIDAVDLLGSIEHECPSRLFSIHCPWEFRGFECGYGGPETECDKSWSRCAQLQNTLRYGGFRFIPHSGTYQYQEAERKRFLLLFSRKKTKTITATFNAVDDTPYDVPIPIVYGRVQIAGIDIQHEDQGNVTHVLSALCVGPVDSVFYVRANDEAIYDYTVHHGHLGGVGQPVIDPRFPHSYPYSLVCYVGCSIPSDVKQDDPAPTITAVVKGKGVSVFGPGGVFQGYQWSDNPIWCVRDFMTMPLAQGGMGIPEELMDDAQHAIEAAYCDEQITDTTNDQQIYLPADLPENSDYRRYRSTGIIGQDPAEDGPYSEWDPENGDTSREPQPLPVRRFTMNVAIAKQEKAVDILYKKLLPSFRGYITRSKEGKYQIRVERPAPSSTITQPASGWQIPVAHPGLFSPGDQIIVSPLSSIAEVCTVEQVFENRIQITEELSHAHPANDEVLKIAMSFDDRNIVSGVTYPLSDRQPSANRITIKYVDAPAGFEARELRINDFENQAKVHKVNNVDLDGAAIDNYFQAWRIGQWRRAKIRDLGKFVEFRADIKATLLEIGDVIAVTATECGLLAAPFRVIDIAFEENDEVVITGQAYSSDIYSDTAPQTTASVPAIFIPSGPISHTPVWHGGIVDTNPADPLYPGETYFELSQEPLPMADGTTKLAIKVRGLAPVNRFIDCRHPLVGSIAAGTGGSLPGGKTHYVSVAAITEDGRYSPLSPTIVITLPPEASKIVLGGITWPQGNWAGYALFGAVDHRQLMTKQSVQLGELPEQIDIQNAFIRSAIPLPNAKFRRIRVKAKRSIHAGVLGHPIEAVAAGKIIISAIASPSDNWQGRLISVIADQADGSAGMWNFMVTAYNPSTGEFTCSPDPHAAGVESGDVLIIRTKPDAVTGRIIADSKWVNQQAPNGMTPGAEKGNLVRIIAGKGRGQVRTVIENTQTALTVDRDWDVTPDATSVFVVEAPQWEYQSDSAPLVVETEGVDISISVPVDNFLEKAVAVIAVEVDSEGKESPEELSPYRETFLYGNLFDLAHPIRTVTSDTVLTTHDHTVLVDCSAGDVIITVADAALMKGKDYTIKRISGGEHNVIVAASGGQLIDGSSSVNLSRQWDSITIRAEA